MRGSKKSLEDHLRDGSFRPDRHGHLLPPGGLLALLPPSAAITKPAGLSPVESAAWDVLVRDVGEVLRAEDAALLAEFVRWQSRAAKIARAMDAMDAELVGTKFYGQLLAAADTATGVLLVLSQRFGLSPSDRGKLVKRTGGAVVAAGSKPKVATRPKTALDRTAPENQA